jgi:hypothetical protein
MIGRAGRLLLAFVIGLAGWWAAKPLLPGPTQIGVAMSASSGQPVPKDCHEANPAWSEVAVDLTSEPAIQPGRVFRLSDGTIAVLVVVTAANADGRATAFDFSASLRVAAVIVHAGADGALIPFDPPMRNGSGLSAPDQGGIDGIAFCYRIQVPNPPPPGATAIPTTPPVEKTRTATSETPSATVTPTPETFEIGAVQTESARATAAAAAQATAETVATQAAAGEATREAESAAAEATIAALATSRAAQDATAAAQATAAADSATAEAAERAAIQATASAEVAAAQGSAAALATTDAARQTELAAAHAAQTEAAATIAALQSTAAAPSPTPAETLLYGVPQTEGFDAWPATPGWSVSNGDLISDGSPFQGYAQPTRTVDRDNYAVEAEIRIVEAPACAANFGIVARGSESGFYAGGDEWICGNGSSDRIWALDRLLAQKDRPIDLGWHTYRLDVNGSHITFSIDGTVVLEATDSTYPAGGQVAIWSNGVKLDVRAFRILVKP